MALEKQSIFQALTILIQSSSCETAEYTADTDALGALGLLEAIRIVGLGHKTRFYQAAMSEMFGKVQETPQRETTPF